MHRRFSTRTIIALAALLLLGATGLPALASSPVAAPTISATKPKAGPVGKKVTITGTGFTGATAVTFQGTTVVSFTVVNDTTITTKVPAGALTGKIAVTTPGGTATSPKKFKVRPTIANVVPGAAPPGSTVTISGSALTAATAVAFNGTPATFSVVDYSTITAVVPAGATAGPITVTTAGGTGTSPAPFIVMARLIMNEVNPNMTGGHDLVELLATTAGPVGGSVVQDPANTPVTLATLPSIQVQAGDLVVIHVIPTTGITTETGSKVDCSDPGCYPNAWDVAGGITGMTYSDRVLAVEIPGGTTVDGVATNNPSTQPATFPAELQALQAAGQWLPANCSGFPCTYLTVPSADDVSANWAGMGTIANGNSLQRMSGTDTNLAGDFHVAIATWGSAN